MTDQSEDVSGEVVKARLSTSSREQRNLRIIAAADSGMTTREISAQENLGERAISQILEHERIRRETKVERSDLSLSAQHKFDAAIRQHQRKLDLEFQQRVLDEVRKRIDGMILPHWKQQIDQANQLYAKRKALMNKETFNTIRRALHPDSRQSISDDKLAAAFREFMTLEKYLLNEQDSPTSFKYPDGSGLPTDLAEWDKRRVRPMPRANRFAVKPR